MLAEFHFRSEEPVVATEQQQRDETQNDQQPQQRWSDSGFTTSDPSLYTSDMLTSPASQSAQWMQAYFDQCEQTLRSSRRVTELAALAAIRSEIVQEIKHQVVNELRQQDLARNYARR